MKKMKKMKTIKTQINKIKIYMIKINYNYIKKYGTHKWYIN